MIHLSTFSQNIARSRLIAYGLNLVDLKQELFNDALWYLEQAKGLPKDSSHDRMRWRYLRASLLFLFSCLDATVNGLLKTKMSGDSWNSFSRLGIERKLGPLLELTFGKPIDRKTDVWRNFKESKKLRVTLEHYEGGAEIYSEKTGITIDNVGKGIENVMAILKEVYRISGIRPHPFVSQTNSTY